MAMWGGAIVSQAMMYVQQEEALRPTRSRTESPMETMTGIMVRICGCREWRGGAGEVGRVGDVGHDSQLRLRVLWGAGSAEGTPCRAIGARQGMTCFSKETLGMREGTSWRS